MFGISFRRKKSGDSMDQGEMQCERLVKLKGNKIEFAGIEIDKVKLGKVGYESTLLQSVSQSIILLDASQYDLCIAIRGLKESDKKETYKEMMVEDKLKSKKFTQALALLLASPESKDLQNSTISLLLENTSRLEELDREKVRLLSNYKDIIQDTSPEIERTSLTSTLSRLKESAAQETVEEKLKNSNIPGTDTSIKTITEEVQSDSINVNDYYFSPDGSYALHKPPPSWNVQNTTLLEIMADTMGITDPELKELWLLNNFQKDQYEKFRSVNVMICQYDKKFIFEPIPGKSSLTEETNFQPHFQL